MKRILILVVLLFSASYLYAQSCPSGAVPIESGGTCATTAAGAVENIVNDQAIAPCYVTLTPNAACSDFYTPGVTDVAQAIMAAAAASLSGYVDATGFPTSSANLVSLVCNDINCAFTFDAVPSTWTTNTTLYIYDFQPMNSLNTTTQPISSIVGNVVTVPVSGITASGSATAGFAFADYVTTNTLDVPANTVVEISQDLLIVGNEAGTGQIVKFEDGSSMIANGSASIRPNIQEGPLFNGTPAASAIGSAKLVITNWAITSGLLTVTTSGYLGGNLPSGLGGQNVTLWGLPEKWLNGFQGNVIGVSGKSFTMAINAGRTGSASENGLVMVTPYPLVSNADPTGHQESFGLSNLSIWGNPSNTNSVGPCLDVQGVFIPTYFINVSTTYCNGGGLRIHPGTVQRIATDIILYNFNGGDGSQVDHPYCAEQIDALDQTLAGSGVSNVTFIAGGDEGEAQAPLLCINGNDLGATGNISFVGQTDWELKAASRTHCGGSWSGNIWSPGPLTGGICAGEYFTDVNPVQITDAFNVRFNDDMWWAGSMPAVSGAPTGLVEINSTGFPVSNLDINFLKWPGGSQAWAAAPIGIIDNVTGVNPTSTLSDCCHNQINGYAPNYVGTRIVDNFALQPLPTNPTAPILGELDYLATAGPGWWDGTIWRRIADTTTLENVIQGMPGNDLLLGIGNFDSAGSFPPAGWINTYGAGITVSGSIDATTYPTGFTNSAKIALSGNTASGQQYTALQSSGGTYNLIGGQPYTFYFFAKTDTATLQSAFVKATSLCAQQNLTISSSWPLSAYSVTCTPATSGTVVISVGVEIPVGTTAGNVWIQGITVIPTNGGISGVPSVFSGPNTITVGTSYAAGGGTAQAQTVTLSPPLTSLTLGTVVRWTPIAANTAAAPTLAINGLTPIVITKCGVSALVQNDLLPLVTAWGFYDGTEVQLLNPQAVACANAANFTGSLAGDVTGTQGSTSVVKVNGAAVPASVNFAGTNPSGQIVQTAIPMVMAFATSIGTANATTYFCTPASSGSSNACIGTGIVSIPLPQAGKFTSCSVSEYCAVGITCAAFSVAKVHNGSTSYTSICTPIANATRSSCTGTPNVSFAAGDEFGISVVTGQASSTEKSIGVSCLWQ